MRVVVRLRGWAGASRSSSSFAAGLFSALDPLLEERAMLLGLPRESSHGPTLEVTQGQIDGFFSQHPYTCHQNRVASVRN